MQVFRMFIASVVHLMSASLLSTLRYTYYLYEYTLQNNIDESRKNTNENYKEENAVRCGMGRERGGWSIVWEEKRKSGA